MRRTDGRSVVLGVVVPAGAGAGGTGADWGSCGLGRLGGWLVGRPGRIGSAGSGLRGTSAAG